MKFKAQKRNITGGVKTAVSVINGKALLPLLNNVHVEAQEQGVVILTATNLEQRIEVTFNAEVSEPGITTIPGRKMLSVINKMPGTEVAVESNEENWHSTITAGKSTVKLLGMPPADFPARENRADGVTIEIEAKELRNRLNLSAYAASTDASRRVLMGVYCQVAEGSLTLVSTDGKHLAYSETANVTVKGEEGNFVVPASTIAAIKGLFPNSNAKVCIRFFKDGKHVSFVCGEITYESKLLKGNYPNYKSVIPKTSKEVNINTEVFLKSLDLVSAISPEWVKLTFTEDNMLNLHGEMPESGAVDTDMEVESKVKLEPVDFQINTAMLREAVSAADDGMAFVFRYNDNMTPVDIDFLNDSHCVIMPIRRKPVNTTPEGEQEK